MMRRTLPSIALALAFPALAQMSPDAGQTLRETQPSGLPALRPPKEIGINPPADAEVLPGGSRVTLSGVRFAGHSLYSDAELMAVLGEVTGQSHDLAGLYGLARRITDHYRAHGYPFAHALIPAQSFTDGLLTIQVVEGRYGKIEAQGDMASRAQRFLAELKPGAVIETSSLERAIFGLADQPGFQVSPLIRPGQDVGTGDLIVEVAQERMVKGELGLDNYGNRYTGQMRARANLDLNSPFTFGDQLQARLIYTDEDLWLGTFAYDRPVGHSGFRWQIGYSHTIYKLGKDFANLKAHGTAKVTNAGFSYPLLRSQGTNLLLTAAYRHKDLEDQQDAVNVANRKKGDALPVSLQFNRRDGRGVIYGSLQYTTGRLSLDAALAATDRTSGTDTGGNYALWNLDVARLQTTPIAPLTLFGRLSTQWAAKNLDSSESFLLGGPSGVRAYPTGEGNGDEGWLVQLEARYRIGAFEPFVFHDAGKVRINADNGRLVAPLADNTRSISGEGLGLRWLEGIFSLDAALAWHNRGGHPTSDTQYRNPRGWVNLTWRF